MLAKVAKDAGDPKISVPILHRCDLLCPAEYHRPPRQWCFFHMNNDLPHRGDHLAVELFNCRQREFRAGRGDSDEPLARILDRRSPATYRCPVHGHTMLHGYPPNRVYDAAEVGGRSSD